MEDPEIGFLEFKETVTKNYYLSLKKGQDADWVYPIKASLSILRKESLKLSIYKVPSKLRRLNEEAYTPRLVSIGPFHRKNPNLRAMEEHKWRHMLSLVHRTPDPDGCLDECGEAVLGLEGRVRASYADSIEFESHQLKEIMLLDGCFILELFLRHLLNDMEEYTHPIFHNAWMETTLRYDLALLENQIPFFVLEDLFNIVVWQMTKHLSSSITELSLSFFLQELRLGREVIKEKYSRGISHLLHLLHIFYLPKSPKESTLKQGTETGGFKNCATNLLEAGIKFENGSEEDNLLDIEFSNRVIKIPTLCIQETTNSLLRNLIAFEQCSLVSTQHITSYAVLMNSLLHSPRDAELLEMKRIITREFGGVEDVLSLFNSIVKEVVVKDFYFGEVRKKVNEYHKSCYCWRWQYHKAFWWVRLPKYGAALKDDYFSNPWKIIAFVAAILLLILTALQTAYTIRAYYPR